MIKNTNSKKLEVNMSVGWNVSAVGVQSTRLVQTEMETVKLIAEKARMCPTFAPYKRAVQTKTFCAFKA
jgi:PP-loop superfamily ATP-utilizing enzyme